jgi:HD superfamily phosphohydrolase
MAYQGHQGVWDGRRIIDGYEGFHGMVTIESGGVQTTENMLIKQYWMRYN